MPPLTDAREMLDREFLQIRSRLLDVAAALDRIDDREGDLSEDPRMLQIRRALERLTGAAPAGDCRAEQLQLIFSRPYRADWRREFGV